MHYCEVTVLFNSHVYVVALQVVQSLCTVVNYFHVCKGRHVLEFVQFVDYRADNDSVILQWMVLCRELCVNVDVVHSLAMPALADPRVSNSVCVCDSVCPCSERNVAWCWCSPLQLLLAMMRKWGQGHGVMLRSWWHMVATAGTGLHVNRTVHVCSYGCLEDGVLGLKIIIDSVLQELLELCCWRTERPS